jgi:MFS family permease
MTDSHGRLHDWTDPTVGPLILVALVVLVGFIVVESRTKEPIMPLDLFRNRTYSASNVATFMLSFGMFASVVFLPRFFQAVRGISATESGYMLWPLLVGLIGSSVGTGILISRLGRYKIILTISTALFIVGSYLLTHIHADTPDWQLWAGMFVSGIGIGPSMAGFTIVIQNSVDRRRIGVATSTLTFLRQIGGTVGLAIAGTLFSQTFTQKLPGRLLAHGVPGPVVQRFNGTNAGSRQNTFTGVDLATQLRHTLPPQLQSIVPNLVAGVHDAFALSIGYVFWLTVASGVVALLAVLVVPDLRLRGRESMEGAAADVIPGADEPVRRAAGQ